ncbi:hypothetical protein P378_11125 [Desulforamulus profundi]|uniref:Uncharacterized protein n=1 Tax=Desulforamulus profundi TaxID=1383067 RepID=A0A2C6MG59_9FIRM|nr:hypothetical protein P378_11125 [Desulforamulus profundi]
MTVWVLFDGIIWVRTTLVLLWSERVKRVLARCPAAQPVNGPFGRSDNCCCSCKKLARC